jgi:hypothetical protein
MTDAAHRTSQWARDLDRVSPFERIVSLMAASRLLGDKAREEKKKLLRKAGWKSVPSQVSTGRRNHVRELWLHPDGSQLYLFEHAWLRHAAKLRRVEQDVCLGCVGKALGIRAPHTHGKHVNRAKHREAK